MATPAPSISRTPDTPERGRLARWTGGLARTCATHAGRVVAIWGLMLAGSIASIVAFLGSGLTTQSEFLVEVESWTGYQLLSDRLPEMRSTGETIVVRSEQLSAEEPAFREFVESLAADVRDTPPVGDLVTGYDAARLVVSPDGHATLITLRMTDESTWTSDVAPVVEKVQAADRDPGFSVAIAGTATGGRDFIELSNQDLRTGELQFGLPAALVVVILVFGAVGAGVLPIAMALVIIPVSLGIAALIGQWHPVSFFLVNMVTAMALALGIDYSLFVVSRYREERRRGEEKVDAIARAGSTAAVAVLFSGTAFTVALLGLLLVPDLILRSLAAGSIIVGVVAVAAALTLLPALMSLMGDHVNALRVPFLHTASTDAGESPARGLWPRVVRAVTRHPLVWLAGSVAFLLACAAPLLSMETGTSGIETLPERTVSRQGFDALAKSFPAGSNANLARVVVDGDVGSPQSQEALASLEQRLGSGGDFGPTSLLVVPDERLAVIDVPLPGDANSDAAHHALADLRETYIPTALEGTTLRGYVTGETAIGVDYTGITDLWLPRVIALTLLVTLVLLTLAFRSLVLSVKAILLNLLSVGAAYGLLVLVFQNGVGAELLGVQQVKVIESWLPVFLFSVLFALSMDYHVFLLTRIRERFSESHDNVDAVVHGISTTARIITGAALIIVVVFAGFAAGDLVMFQQMGLGVAVALLIDATIVRSVVVPASMTLLGRWNWYLPRWLAWLPELQLDAPVTHATSPPPCD